MFSIFEQNPTYEGGTNPTRPPVKPSRRRDKVQLSCTICRQKKLRCDRMKPCINCNKRGQPELCEYVKHAQQGGQQGIAAIQDRLRQLENMVEALSSRQTVSVADSSFVGKSPSSSSPDDGDFNHLTAPVPHTGSMGKLSDDNGHLNFVGGEHWETILESIADLKIDLEISDTTESDAFKPQLLFGNNHASRSEMLSSLPSKSICDRIITRWFKQMDMAPMVIHIPTFMKEYHQIFKTPNQVPLMSIGLLFSVLSLGCHFYAIAGEELPVTSEHFSSMSEMTDIFRDRTAQCLVEVNYLRPRKYTVETLVLHFGLEKFRGRDTEFGSYVLLGILIRVAMRLGYHRDAKHFPSISLFDAEMRRRVWCILRHFDFMNSAQIGLPRLVHEGETDTAEPMNLLDSDFDEETKELPPPRPSTEVTVVSFAVSQLRLNRHLGSIVDQVNSLKPPSYSEVMALDSKLLETHATLPPSLAMSTENLLTEDVLIQIRINTIEVLFQKSRCLLHRKYLIPGKSDPNFRYSRIASVDAAMKLLSVQHNIYEATQRGGQWSGERWRTSALLNHDYVLAAMIVSLDIAWDTRIKHLPLNLEDEIEAIWPKSRRLQALKASYDIWCQASSSSNLAAKATDALKAMLKDIHSSDSTTHLQTSVMPNATDTSDVTLAPQLSTYDNESYQDNSGTFNFNIPYFMEPSTSNLATESTDVDMPFDWNLWDSQFQPAPVMEEDFGSLPFQ